MIHHKSRGNSTPSGNVLCEFIMSVKESQMIFIGTSNNKKNILRQEVEL